jgi:hypothetical protein
LDGTTNIINVGTGITINGSTGIISATSIVLGGTTLTGAGVTSITAGSGISVDQSTGNVTITATGGGSSQWVTTAAGIHTLSNVGIGTTNPTSALTVTGNGTFTGVVTATTFVGALTGTATTATNAQGLTGTPNITVGVATASTLNVGTSGTIITTTTAGLVGIGTTNPTSALTVKGSTSLETLSVSGVSTLSNTIVGGATTQLIVNGNARITGMVTAMGGVTVSNNANTLRSVLITDNGSFGEIIFRNDGGSDQGSIKGVYANLYIAGGGGGQIALYTNAGIFSSDGSVVLNNGASGTTQIQGPVSITNTLSVLVFLHSEQYRFLLV